ncbi:hypothetical protein L207DRAFT_579714 [Hyaloscypha variabilis F]|uniref:Uncharacterized protein n=1 Tax=Hyaloscypha variabilis (strain UAMH 11265 / GT02V1 / F) TaxID=1149755 RepID=A0A2J6S214_HYAVF|nr:hypothetical protein L207DRAFT_579714 [Hyaloscypha variabilis F]
MAPSWSQNADHGAGHESLKSENDSLPPSNSHTVTETSIVEAQNDLYRGDRSWFLDDWCNDTIRWPVHHRHSSATEAVTAQRNHMASYLNDFDDAMEKSSENFLYQGVLSLQVFAARDRFPGEQLPWRLSDRKSSTQPLRRSRIGSRPNTPLASLDGAEGQSAESLRRRRPRSHQPPLTPGTRLLSLLTSTSDSLTPNTSSEEKGKGPTNHEASKDQPSLYSSDVQKQEHFVANDSMNCIWPAAEAGPCQSFGQPYQPPPNQSWIPRSPAHTNGISSVMLPNDMVWLPQESLFSQGEQLPQMQPPPNASQDSCSGDDNSSLISYTRRLASPSNPLFVTMQAGPTYHEDPSASNSNAYTGDDSFNPEPDIPSLTFESSSSQAHYSPFDSAGNYIPPPLGERLQPQVSLDPSDVPRIREEEQTQGDDDGEKMVDKKEGWKMWVNWNISPDQES